MQHLKRLRLEQITSCEPAELFAQAAPKGEREVADIQPLIA